MNAPHSIKKDLYIAGFACYLNAVGDLSDYFDYLYSDRKRANKNVLQLNLEEQLTSCLEQSIKKDFFKSNERVTLLSTRHNVSESLKKSLEHIIKANTVNSLSLDRLSNCLTKASQLLSRDLTDYVIIVDNHGKERSQSTAILVLTRRDPGYHNHKIVFENVLEIDTKNKDNLLNTVIENGPGLVLLDENLAPDICLLDETIKSKGVCSYTFGDSDISNSHLIDLIKLVLCIATKTFLRGNRQARGLVEQTKNINPIEQCTPWIQARKPGESSPCRHGAFLFKDGDNKYMVKLKETIELVGNTPLPVRLKQDSEVFIFGGTTQDELLDCLTMFRSLLARANHFPLQDLAYTINCKFNRSDCPNILSIVASDSIDLCDKIDKALTAIASGAQHLEESFLGTGIYYATPETRISGKLAFLLPGLGSAYPYMLADLLINNPVATLALDYLDYLAMHANSASLPSQTIFPISVPQNKNKLVASLMKADYAVAAILMIEKALDFILKDMNLVPDAYLGLSTGEYGSYCMNGYANLEELAPQFFKFIVDIAKSIPESDLASLRTINVFAEKKIVEELLYKLDLEIYIIADLAPNHVMATGSIANISNLEKGLSNLGLVSHMMTAAIPYHTPIVENLLNKEQVNLFGNTNNFGQVEIPSWSCALGGLAPRDSAEIESLAKNLFRMPIRLNETIKKMHEDGIEIFVEVGPSSIVTAKVKEILKDFPVLAIASNVQGKSAVTQINHVIAQLSVHGKYFELKNQYKRRNCEEIEELTATPSVKVKATDELVLSSYRDAIDKIKSTSIEASRDVMARYEEITQSSTKPSDQILFLPISSESTDSIVLAWVESACLDLAYNSYMDCLHEHFTRAERAEVSTKFTNKKRIQSWIMGRLAAKRAVQALLQKEYARTVHLCDIEITNNNQGKPEAQLLVKEEPMILPVSISHTNQIACALVSAPLIHTVGVDMEEIRSFDLDMPELVLNEAEQSILRDSLDQRKTSLQMWTAKEAAYKAIGAKSIKKFEVVNIEEKEGRLTMKYDNGHIQVFSGTIDNHIVSYTALPASKTRS